jgi:septal ring factor EnvC (AmiA/AmiB activator)
MLEQYFELTLHFFRAVLMAQLTTLAVEPGNQDSIAKSFATLKNKLAEKRAARVKAQADAKTLARVIEDLKKMTDGFAAQVLALEEKVKHLDNKVLDSQTKLIANELCLERTTKANDDYKSQNTRLTKKLESKLPSPLSLRSCTFLIILVIPLRLAQTEAELNALKAMVENAVSFFYPNDTSLAARAPLLLDGLPTRS